LRLGGILYEIPLWRFNGIPLQRDFLGLMDNYVDTSVKAITLENTVFDLKETIMDRRRLKNSVLDEMDNFLLTVETAISGAVSRSKEQETIVKYAEKSKDFLKKYIEDGKTKFSDDIFQEIAEFEKKVSETDEDGEVTIEKQYIKDNSILRSIDLDIEESHALKQILQEKLVND
jgi:hypothetical protein